MGQRIDPALVVEIKVINAQARQRRITPGFNISRATTDVKAAIIAFQAEFDCENHLVAPVSDGTSNHAFVMSITIDIGCSKHASATSCISVFLHTNAYQQDVPQYGNRLTRVLLFPTSFTPNLFNVAMDMLSSIYREGYA
jgi:hypothetical protein